MTPIEVMAKAINEKITAIYGSPPDRGEGEAMARVALLALAECELPAWSDDGKASYRVLDPDKRSFQRLCKNLAEAK